MSNFLAIRRNPSNPSQVQVNLDKVQSGNGDWHTLPDAVIVSTERKYDALHKGTVLAHDIKGFEAEMTNTAPAVPNEHNTVSQGRVYPQSPVDTGSETEPQGVGNQPSNEAPSFGLPGQSGVNPADENRG